MPQFWLILTTKKNVQDICRLGRLIPQTFLTRNALDLIQAGESQRLSRLKNTCVHKHLSIRAEINECDKRSPPPHRGYMALQPVASLLSVLKVQKCQLCYVQIWGLELFYLEYQFGFCRKNTGWRWRWRPNCENFPNYLLVDHPSHHQ